MVSVWVQGSAEEGAARANNLPLKKDTARANYYPYKKGTARVQHCQGKRVLLATTITLGKRVRPGPTITGDKPKPAARPPNKPARSLKNKYQKSKK